MCAFALDYPANGSACAGAGVALLRTDYLFWGAVPVVGCGWRYTAPTCLNGSRENQITHGMGGSIHFPKKFEKSSILSSNCHDWLVRRASLTNILRLAMTIFIRTTPRRPHAPEIENPKIESGGTRSTGNERYVYKEQRNGSRGNANKRRLANLEAAWRQARQNTNREDGQQGSFAERFGSGNDEGLQR